MSTKQEEIKKNSEPVRKLKPLKQVSTSVQPPEKKSGGRKTQKKGFLATMREMMYASADVEETDEDTKATLENISEVLAEINDELPKNETKEEEKEKKIPEQVRKPERKKSQDKKPETEAFPVRNGKYSLLALVCIILAIIGVIAIINAFISGDSSSDDKYRKAVYPAVITDINAFENPSELPVNQILSTAVWSIIIDNEKLSAYPQRVSNMAVIPAEDIEKYATEIFGENIPVLTHSTIVTSDSKFYYNEEADSYSVEINPHTFTYSPEVVSVSRESGKYIVEVDYIDQHPEWIDETVAKTVVYTLTKNDNGGYMIESMHESGK